MPGAGENFIEGPAFECACCGLCCRRDPYYAVSLLDIHNISTGMGLGATEFFDRFCAIVDTPGGFRYPVILAPDGCPFLKDNMCGIHAFKPIGCRVFPQSALVPVRVLKKSVTAIPACAILAMPDDERPLKADTGLLAARDVHFEHTRRYFEAREAFEEKSWREAMVRLIEQLSDAKALRRRSLEIRAQAKAQMTALK